MVWSRCVNHGLDLTSFVGGVHCSSFIQQTLLCSSITAIHQQQQKGLIDLVAYSLCWKTGWLTEACLCIETCVLTPTPFTQLDGTFQCSQHSHVANIKGELNTWSKLNSIHSQNLKTPGNLGRFQRRQGGRAEGEAERGVAPETQSDRLIDSCQAERCKYLCNGAVHFSSSTFTWVGRAGLSVETGIRPDQFKASSAKSQAGTDKEMLKKNGGSDWQ